MVRNQKGFTIIELVVVIVILGILAAVAFPKFQELSGDAKSAVAQGALAALKSAAVITYAKKQGVPQPFADIKLQVSSENVTITGPCNNATVVHTSGGTTYSTDLSEYCSG